MQIIEESMEQEEQVQEDFNIIEVLPGQIGALWQVLKAGIVAAQPVGVLLDEENLGNILQALLAGRMQAFVITKDKNIVGSLTTNLLIDTLSGTRNLFIYSLYTAVPSQDSEIWALGLEVLRKKAKELDCFKIMSYTSNERIIQMVDRIGGSTTMRVVELEV